MDAKTEHLIQLLQEAQAQLRTAPVQNVGVQGIAIAGPGGGTAIGAYGSVTAGGTGSGLNVGIMGIAGTGSPSGVISTRRELSTEIEEAIQGLRQGGAPKSWLRRIAGSLGSAALGVGGALLKDQIEHAIGVLP